MMRIWRSGPRSGQDVSADEVGEVGEVGDDVCGVHDVVAGGVQGGGEAVGEISGRPDNPLVGLPHTC